MKRHSQPCQKANMSCNRRSRSHGWNRTRARSLKTLVEGWKLWYGCARCSGDLQLFECSITGEDWQKNSSFARDLPLSPSQDANRRKTSSSWYWAGYLVSGTLLLHLIAWYNSIQFHFSTALTPEGAKSCSRRQRAVAT